VQQKFDNFAIIVGLILVNLSLGIIVIRTRAKICGITSVDDALLAVEAGADAIGLVFYPASPRAVNIEQAEAIAANIPAFVTTVALTVDSDAALVTQLLERVQVDVLQFHGDETAEYCGQFKHPYIKAIRMHDSVDLHQQREIYSRASGLLLDAYKPGVPGGTGESFEWDRIPKDLACEVILAGGLTPENVRGAIEQVGPYAVDVSGGVEAKKGVKDPQKVKRFIQQVILAAGATC